MDGVPAKSGRWEARVDFEKWIVQTIEYFRGCLERGEVGERLQM